MSGALLVLLIVTAQAGSAQRDLDAALSCYQQLDYACAQERLAVALRGELAPEDQLQARYHQALLALAFQDEVRARQAVGALLALDPAYDPGPQAPPRIRRLLDAQRPRPSPPFRWGPLLRLDGRSVVLFGNDSSWWRDGPGAELALGLASSPRNSVSLGFSYSQHQGRSFHLEQLELSSISLGAQRRVMGRSLALIVGAALTLSRVSVQGITGEQSYWAGGAQLDLEVTLHLGGGFWLGLRASPGLLGAEDSDRAAFSLILPVGLGLRYDFEGQQEAAQ